MKETRIIMGMPVTVEIVDRAPGADAVASASDLAAIFDYFTYIDKKFSTYKPESEMMRINRGELAEREWSDDMRIIFMLAEETKQRTDGFFDIQKPNQTGANGLPFYDPSGIVKGWAIWQAAKLKGARDFKNFYVDAGGDIQTGGVNHEDKPWSVGIKNPFKQTEIVKIVYLDMPGARWRSASSMTAVATSGTYIRGEHIYNPKTGTPSNEIVSLTVIGPNIYEADRFATAAFAMGARGIHFIESLPGLEGYMMDKDGIATMTTGFEKYTVAPAA